LIKIRIFENNSKGFDEKMFFDFISVSLVILESLSEISDCNRGFL